LKFYFDLSYILNDSLTLRSNK